MAFRYLTKYVAVFLGQVMRERPGLGIVRSGSEPVLSKSDSVWVIARCRATWIRCECRRR